MIDKLTLNNKPYYLPANSYNFTHSQNRHNDLSLKQKAIVTASSIAAMTPVLGFFAHKKGFSLNPANIFKTPVKDWALLKFKPLDKVITFKAPEILSIAVASVAGGFTGGAIIDPKNIKAKKREALNQLLGDVLVPIGCVFLGSLTFNRFKNPLHKLMPQLKDNNKFTKALNMILYNIPDTIATLGSLCVGIIAGNKVSNEINEKLYHKKVDRGIKATDFAPHLDDLCLSIAMVNEQSTFASKLSRIIPLALVIPGYETGTAQENKKS